MRVACAQLAPVIGDLAGNRQRAAAALREAAEAGAELVVLPELCSSGYVFADAGEARALAEGLDGPAVTSWRELSGRHGIVIVGGLCERLDGAGRPANTAVTVDRGAVASVYRKAHLWGIAVPMNTPVLAPLLEPLAAEVMLAVASAIGNRVFVAQCDRTGDERGVSWVGASAIVDPDGRLLTERAEGETILLADVDLGAAASKRVGTRNDVLADRRPELYGA